MPGVVTKNVAAKIATSSAMRRPTRSIDSAAMITGSRSAPPVYFAPHASPAATAAARKSAGDWRTWARTANISVPAPSIIISGSTVSQREWYCTSHDPARIAAAASASQPPRPLAHTARNTQITDSAASSEVIRRA